MNTPSKWNRPPLSTDLDSVDEAVDAANGTKSAPLFSQSSESNSGELRKDSSDVGDVLPKPSQTVYVQKNLDGFTPQEQLAIEELIARGYTNRRIQQVLLYRNWTKIPSSFALLTYRTSAEYKLNAPKVHERIAQQVFSTGIALKEDRLRRLQLVADRFEEAVGIHPDDLAGIDDDRLPDQEVAPLNIKAAETLLKVYEQARRETDGMGIIVPLNQNDPWAQLLQALQPQINRASEVPRLEPPPQSETSTDQQSSAQ